MRGQVRPVAIVATPPPAATMAPMAAQPSPMQNPTATDNNFLKLAKQAGLHHVNFDKNPVIARTQLTHHLQQKFGADYANNPEAQQLLSSFNNYHGGSHAQRQDLDTGALNSMKALMGHG